MKRKFVHIESNDLAVLATILIIWNMVVIETVQNRQANLIN
jgi:hypothetical protein